jgi:hypothetical protein
MEKGQLSIELGLADGAALPLAALATTTTSLHKLLRHIERNITGKPARIRWTVAGVEYLRGRGFRLTLQAEGPWAQQVSAAATKEQTA